MDCQDSIPELPRDSHSTCTSDVGDILDCSRVVAVDDNFDACISSLQNSSCDALFSGGQLDLPAICNDVLLVQGATTVSEVPWVDEMQQQM